MSPLRDVLRKKRPDLSVSTYPRETEAFPAFYSPESIQSVAEQPHNTFDIVFPSPASVKAELQASPWKQHKLSLFDDAQEPASRASDQPLLSSHKRTLSTPISPNVNVASERRRHPFFPNLFEAPAYEMLVLHAFLCVATFPIVYCLPMWTTRGLGLTVLRAIVGAISGIIGALLSFSLTELGRRSFEASLWATVVQHSSRSGQNVTLNDLHYFMVNPTSMWSAIHLLLLRIAHATRPKHKGYHWRAGTERFWSLHILGYILLAIMAALISFTFGRIVTITTHTVMQRTDFTPVGVYGDLSIDDLDRAAAQTGAFVDYIRTWTLTSYSSSSRLPSPVSFPSPYEDRQVYFAETVLDQFVPNGRGFGMFDSNGTLSDTNYDSSNNNDPMSKVSRANSASQNGNGRIIRSPHWGIRIKCSLLDDFANNFVAMSESGLTYAFIPRTTLEPLFSSLNRTMPSFLYTPANLTKLLEANDTVPAGLNPANISLGAKWWNNGSPFSSFSSPLTMGQDGSGWLQIELVLVRLNNSQTPIGSFPAYGAELSGTAIGYDLGVCVEAVEPWILDVYNSTTSSPTTLSIVRQANTVFGFDGRRDERNRVQKYDREDSDLMGNLKMNSMLNSTGKADAWIAAHDNSRNMLIKDSSTDFWYSVSPTTVALTGGHGPQGYTHLSPEAIEETLATADASHLLPYLAGSQQILAHSFEDKTLAYTSVPFVWLLVTLLVILLAGLIPGLLIPKLPLGLPRRDFSVFSIIAATEGDKLVEGLFGEKLVPNMTLDDYHRELGDMSVRYHA